MNKFLHTILYRIILPSLYILGWAFLYFMPRGIFHEGGDASTFLLVSLLLILPGLLFFILRGNAFTKEWSKKVAFASLFLVVPFMFLVNYQDGVEFYQDKERTLGVISKSWLAPNYKSVDTWVVKASYKVRGVSYETSSKNDRDKTLLKGDTVTIVYSTNTPQHSEIEELIKYYEGKLQ